MNSDRASLRKRLEQRRAALRQDEQVMEPHWRELREYIQPFRGRFAGEQANQTAPSMAKIIRAEALAWRLALDLAVPLTGGKTSLREHLTQYYINARTQAMLKDANEFDAPAPVWAQEYTEARR